MMGLLAGRRISFWQGVMNIKRLQCHSMISSGNIAVRLRRRIAIRQVSRNRRSGAALVELMICLIVLLPMLLWTIQMAYLMDAVNTMSQISYTVARYAASHGRDNNPTDVADNDYNDPNEDSVLYAAYQACNSTLIPYGRGFNNGSSNTYTVVSLTGATITMTYTASGSTVPESTAAKRNLGDSVSVAVQYDLDQMIFMPSYLPGIATIEANTNGSMTRTSYMVLIQ
jgi:Flp pilus assembly protein TadG